MIINSLIGTQKLHKADVAKVIAALRLPYTVISRIIEKPRVISVGVERLAYPCTFVFDRDTCGAFFLSLGGGLETNMMNVNVYGGCISEINVSEDMIYWARPVGERDKSMRESMCEVGIHDDPKTLLRYDRNGGAYFVSSSER